MPLPPYDNMRSPLRKSAASAYTAQLERCYYQNQSAVCTSHNVPSNNLLDLEDANVIISDIQIQGQTKTITLETPLAYHQKNLPQI